MDPVEQSLEQNIASVFAEDDNAANVMIPGSGEIVGDPPPLGDGNPPPPPPPSDDNPSPPPPLPGGDPTSGLNIKQMANILKKRVSSADFNYEIPKHIETGLKEDGTAMTEEDYFDAMRDEIYKFTDFGHDDFVEEYLVAKQDPNFNRDAFLASKTQQQSFVKLSDDEKIFLGTKAQVGDKMTDAEITEYVKGLDKVQKITLAKQITNQYLSQQEVVTKQQMAANKQKTDAMIANKQLSDKTKLDTLFQKLSTVDNIGGLPHGKAEQEAFQGAFRDLYDIDPATGNRRYEEVLEDPENLYNALLFLSMVKNGQVKTHLSKYKESYKASVFDKLGLGPRADDGGIVIDKRVPTAADYTD